ncbi:MAG: dockerin type I domain-containing protein [Phycisphaerae bacterium]
MCSSSRVHARPARRSAGAWSWSGRASDGVTAVLLTLGAALLLPAALAQRDERAAIAQGNLRFLLFAEQIYSNNNNEWFPLDPAWLYPEIVDTPQTFWHPGDADNPQPPAVINNSASNAPNSARISFDFLITRPGLYADDDVAIRDNTTANNEGAFINFVTLDGVIETDPPLAARTPTRFALARQHLARFGTAFAVYANDNSDRLPLDLLVLWQQRRFRSPRTFWNPGDVDPLPLSIDSSEPDGPRSTQVSFAYLAPGAIFSALPPDAPVMRDNTPTNNAGYGVYELHANGIVVFVPVCPGDVDGDQDVDMHDFARMQAGFAHTPHATPPDGDVDADGTIWQADAEIVLTNLGNECAG